MKFEVQKICANNDDESVIVYFIEVASPKGDNEKVHQKTIHVAGINYSTDVDALSDEIISKCSVLNLQHKEDVIECLRQLQTTNRRYTESASRSDSRMSFSAFSSTVEMNKSSRSTSSSKETEFSIDQLDLYVEMLYETGDGVAKGVAAVVSLAMIEDNLDILVKNDTLLSALLRLLCESGSKNVRVAYGVLKFLHKLAEYSQFHVFLIEQKVGSTVMDFVNVLVTKYKAPRTNQDSNIKAELDGVRRSIEKILQVSFSLLDLLAEDVNVQSKMVHRGIIHIIAISLRKFALDGNGDKYWIRSALLLLHSTSVFREAVSEMKIKNHCVCCYTRITQLHRRVQQQKSNFLFEYVSAVTVKIDEFSCETREESKSSEKKVEKKRQEVIYDSVASETLEYLHVILHQYRHDNALAEVCLKVLLNLSFSTMARGQMIKLGYIDLLVKILGSSSLVPHSIRLIYQLSVDEPNRYLLTKCDQLLYQLNKLISTPANWSDELLALCINLCLDEGSTRSFVENPEQLYLLGTKAKNGLILRLLRTASQYLSLPLAKIICEDFQTFQFETMDVSFVTELLNLAGNVAASSEDKHLNSLLASSVNHLLSEQVDPMLTLASVCCCGIMASQPIGAEILTEENTVEQLIDVIQKYQEEDEIVLQSIYALYQIIRNGDSDKKAIYTGAYEFLLDLATDANSAIRRVCSEALDHLAEGHPELNDQVMTAEFEWHNASWIEMVKHNILVPRKSPEESGEGEGILIYDVDDASFISSDA
ncbi:kinesin-associated protein 3-like isoform X2 [Artemia franciscana]|uniref:kinesin-associated protein 3-like isoform X2 n=1 Tax=Artemia franciscana TaxID=6661 RepID=UPI0032DAB22E